MTVRIHCEGLGPKNGLGSVLDSGNSRSGAGLLASVLPVITDIFILLQMVDIKTLFLAMEGTEHQALYKEALCLEVLPKLGIRVSMPVEYEVTAFKCAKKPRAFTEEAMALRFLCVTLGLKVDLPRDYWEEDCRWLIVNLQYEDAKELIEKEDLKVDVNAKVGYSDKSLFHMAAERGRVDLVRSMIKHRAVKINHTNKDGYTALHFAIYYDYPQVVVTLLEYGADVNLKTYNNRDTPLHLAARYKESDCVLPLLMHRDIKVNETNTRNRTPLDRAMFHQHLDSKDPVMVEVRTVEQLFPPDYSERHGIIRGSSGNGRRSWWSCLVNKQLGMTSTFKNMEKMAASDQALLEALAAAAADVNSGKYALNIPVTSSPGLSPLKLPGIDEDEEEEDEQSPRSLITLETISQRKVLRNTIDQLRSCGARTIAEMVALDDQGENMGEGKCNPFSSMWQWIAK